MSTSSPVHTALSTTLADTYALMAQTHHAHWNIEGTDFFQLHAAFQAQYEELFAAIDELAERLRSLGAYAPGGLATLAKLSTLTEFPAGPAPAAKRVEHLVNGHGIVLAGLVTLRDEAEKARDLETQDLAIGRIQIHQKTVWMLKSFLQGR